MKQFYASNFAGQIIYVEYATLKGDNEGYQEYLDRVNKEVDSQHNVDLTLFDVWNMGPVAKEEIKGIDEKDIKEFIKNHNVVMMLTLMACDIGDIKPYDKIMEFRGTSLLKPIAKLKKLVNNKNLYEIPLEELFSLFMEHDFIK